MVTLKVKLCKNCNADFYHRGMMDVLKLNVTCGAQTDNINVHYDLWCWLSYPYGLNITLDIKTIILYLLT